MAVRKTQKLTKAKIEALLAPDPSGTPQVHWDSTVTGFGVLCSGKSNVKSFVVQRENRKKIPRRTIQRLDRMAKNWSLDEMRETAKDWLRQIGDGIDPSGKISDPNKNMTLQGALDSYIQFKKNLRPATVADYKATITRYLSDWLDLPLQDISADMVEARHREIKEQVAGANAKREKSNWLVSGDASANSAMRVLRILYNHATPRVPDLPPNPVTRLKGGWFDVKRRKRKVEKSELPAFWAALGDLPNSIHGDYLRLILFTGFRRSEAASLMWADIDLAEKVIHIPEERTKTGDQLDIPMSDITHSLLTARRGIGTDGPWIFPANAASGHIEEPRFALDEVEKICGIKISVHDLRRTFITVAESCDIAAYALKALVNHTLGGQDVTAGYISMDTDRLRKPMQKVADRLKEYCEIETPHEENVTELK